MEKKLSVIMGTVFGVALVICALLFVCYNIWTSNLLSNAQIRQIREVTVLTVTHSPVQPLVQIYPSAILDIEPVAKKRVYAQVDGKISAIYVEQGSQVKKGQLIAGIGIIELPEKITQAEAGLNTARIQLDQANSDAVRYEELYRKNATSTALYEQYLSKQKTSREALRIAQAQYDQLKEKIGEAAVYSPMDGRLVQGYGQIGKIVHTGDDVAVVGDYSQVLLHIRVEKEIVLYNYTGEMLGLRPLLPQFKDKSEIKGIIKKITPDDHFSPGGAIVSILIAEGSYDMVYQFNQGLILKLPVSTTALVLPNSACFFFEGKYYIFVVDEQSVIHKREVEVDNFDSYLTQVQVLTNLREGEVVVEKGLYDLKDGEKVRIRKN